MEPLVERLRLVKTPTEVEMIRRAVLYADYGVERLLAVSYHGASVAESFAETRMVTSRIIREVHDWEALSATRWKELQQAGLETQFTVLSTAAPFAPCGT